MFFYYFYKHFYHLKTYVDLKIHHLYQSLHSTVDKWGETETLTDWERDHNSTIDQKFFFSFSHAD
jgi:hypothetical protein